MKSLKLDILSEVSGGSSKSGMNPFRKDQPSPQDKGSNLFLNKKQARGILDAHSNRMKANGKPLSDNNRNMLNKMINRLPK